MAGPGGASVMLMMYSISIGVFHFYAGKSPCAIGDMGRLPLSNLACLSDVLRQKVFSQTRAPDVIKRFSEIILGIATEAKWRLWNSALHMPSMSFHSGITRKRLQCISIA